MPLLNRIHIVRCQAADPLPAFYQRLNRQRRELEARRLRNFRSFRDSIKEMGDAEMRFIQEQVDHVKDEVTKARDMYEPKQGPVVAEPVVEEPKP
jgi:hypothetical protein